MRAPTWDAGDGSPWRPGRRGRTRAVWPRRTIFRGTASWREFRGQHRDHGVVRKFGHLDRDEMHSHLAEFREGGIVEFSVVLCSCARRLSPLFPLFSLLLLLGSGGRFFLRGLLLLVWFPFECG